jgi:integrase/recombinase XerD
MPRDFIKELRGDVRRDAIDIYNHIDMRELRESYLAHIPQLGV